MRGSRRSSTLTSPSGTKAKSGPALNMSGYPGWPPRAAVRQFSIADITFSWSRLTWPALALRHAGPRSRKISATKAGRDTRAALAGWPDLAELGEAACAERHSGQCRRAGADLDSTSSLWRRDDGKARKVRRTNADRPRRSACRAGLHLCPTCCCGCQLRDRPSVRVRWWSRSAVTAGADLGEYKERSTASSLG